MKRFLSTSVLVVSLLSSPLAYGDDYGLVRQYMRTEAQQKGSTPGSFARQLGVSRTTVYNFLSHGYDSPKLLKHFKSRLPNIYQKITTPEKPIKKVVIKKTPTLPVRKLDFSDNSFPLLADDGSTKTYKETSNGNLAPIIPFNSPSKILKQKKKVKKEETIKAPIMVAYREEGDGKGAFFDHFTIQKATDYPTKIASHPNMRLKTVEDHIKTITYSLSYGTNKEGKIIPNVADNPSEGGLLVIPGRARANEFDPLRQKHENNLIKQARLTGQPILAICAGSWRLWESFGGSLINVEDHCYGGGMIRINHNGKIGYNVQIHDIKVTPATILAGIMKTSEDDRPSVNSLHWKAPSSQTIPSFLTVSAKAVANDDITLNNRQGEIMKPEEDAIEAFESPYGAPLMGIQWHPEAYSGNDSNSKKNKSLLKYMAKAGTAYHQKRQMLKELEEVTSKYN